MKKYSTADLRKLEIVNLCNGSRLGYAGDFVFESDGCCTRVVSLIIPGSKGFLGIGKTESIVIPWKDVECIGDDTVLVRYSCCREGKGDCCCGGMP